MTFRRSMAAVLLAASLGMTLLFNGIQCYASGGPESIFLVVNANSVDSRTVANHYIDVRKIPSTNVFYLNFPAGRGNTPGKLFRTRILTPIFKEIEKRKLQGQIDYIVYSCDFPWRIDFRKDFPGEVFTKVNTPVASITSATYLYAFVLGQRKEMFALNSNFYCSPVNDLVVVSRACRSSYRWSLGGRRAGQEGLPYMLSAMLGVNTVPGNTVEEIAWYLNRSATADGTSPSGTIYFAVNNTIRSKVRDQGFSEAVRQLLLSGVNAEIVKGFFPRFKQNVAGVTCGHSLVNPAGSQCRFLPGAFMDNLTSSGAQFLPEKTQTLISEFLRMGAAGACGTVVEPRAISQKFPNNTLHVHYAHGCSLAESFYQSVAGPYQQLLLGDPLCQPWARIPAVTVSGFTDGAIVKDSVEIIPSATTKEATIASFQLFVDGVAGPKCTPGERLPLDTTKLADGHHELRVVAIDNTPMETQGRWIGSVIVKNGTDAVQLTVEDASLASGADKLVVSAAATNQVPVKILCNGSELGKTVAGERTVTIDKGKTGSGPITLTGVTDGEPGLRSRPLRVVLGGS